MIRKGFVAVHVGAGYHSPANADLYKGVCEKACHQAVQLLNKGHSALEAVVAAIVSLEDSQCTNAGIGSNLTMAGTVECDASIMDGKSLHYGAVGAVSGVKNPIKVAESLMNLQFLGEMPLGRIAPCTLVGQGAYEWAKEHGLSVIIDKNELITENSRKTFIKNKRKLDLVNEELMKARVSGVGFKTSKLYDNSNNNSDRNKTVRATNRTLKNAQTSDVFVDEIASNVEISSEITFGINAKSNLAYDNRGNGVRGRIPKFNIFSKNNLTQQKSKLKNIKNQHQTNDCNNNNSDNIPNSIAINNTDSDDTSKNNYNDSCNNSSNDDNRRQVDVRNDTVGAICVDEDGRIVSAVSSGGIILKHPGRLGQAAMYGCGCWAENDENGQCGAAASTSGCGEQLSKTMLAKECVLTLKEFIVEKKKNKVNNSNNNNDDEDGGDSDDDSDNGDGREKLGLAEAVNECFMKKFINSPFLKHERQPLGGALVVTVEKVLPKPKDFCSDDSNGNWLQAYPWNKLRTVEGDIDDDESFFIIELMWAHTTESMCLGYMGTGDKKAKAVLSRLPEGHQVVKSLPVGGTSYYM
ncbi:hypothetical protein HELRODRAFT_188697 [Helobdella robusta]|uniref:Uncharacterized protein n=1 Tax=Helobdella robusta TaxID=6412 RepID=T1FQ97_HELRO|nr:hypothetical protein HELRODRAFT_188697 [Helobdella robusta]ESO02417.1 hypothetical protein HELRODRAFT_188697 [Helobdella robusta]